VLRGVVSTEGATAVAALPALSLKRDRLRNGNVNASFTSLRPWGITFSCFEEVMLHLWLLAVLPWRK
jgi:hypothetical protein